MKKFLKFWFTNLPYQHTAVGSQQGSWNYILRWFIHPIKRRIAKYYLILLRRLFGLKVIGITGSAGKTTTKEMLASILKLEGKTVYSYANIDPVYNIPTTILKCTPSTKYLILEMGVEYPGEMNYYLWLAKPDIGIITNIYPTHTEYFGELGGVFNEKKKLAELLSSNNLVVLNSQNDLLRKLKGTLKAKEVWFGNGTGVMSSLEKINNDFKTEFLLIFDQNENKRVKIILPVLGLQFVENALAASATAYTLGISIEKIKKGLENFEVAEHRMKVIKHKSGAIIIDDSYNNNPEAAKKSIDQVYRLSKNLDVVIVFGDMLELGKMEDKYHREIGEYLIKNRISTLITVGKAAKAVAKVVANGWGKHNVSSVDTWQEALPLLNQLLKKNTLILIKGSRSIGLDRLVAKII